MTTESSLAVILHADIVNSTLEVQRDEVTAHTRFQEAFRLLSDAATEFGGRIREVRGDALVAEFSGASDAIRAAVRFQGADDTEVVQSVVDDAPKLRIGIAIGEVVFADDTVTGAGVVLAQRIEQLAPPGGICVSAAIREAVSERLDVDYEDLGERELKGFRTAQRVYRVAQQAKGSRLERPDTLGKPAGEVEDARPSIAVLPFDNLSSDPEQDYFVDGVSEELITELSRFRWLRVIARNSSFVYKGRATDVRQIADELNVKYVLEGSARKAGQRVRVTAQLIDGASGDHIWAERYERALEDVFELQDELTNSIAVALSPELYNAEAARSRSKTQDLTSWDLFLRARDQYYVGNQESNLSAIELARKAIGLDPENVGALYVAASALYLRVLNNWTDEKRACFDEALAHAEKAVELDPRDARGHRVLGLLYLGFRRFDEALRALETATDLNTSYPEAMVSLGTCCFYVGQAQRGVELVERAIALSPRDPEMTLWRCTLSLGYLLTGDYEKGIECAKYCASRKDYFAPSRWYWAANSGYAEKPEESEAARQEVLRLNPNFSIAQLERHHPFVSRDDFDVLVKGLEQAGLFA